jgi:hypothetical protein
MAAILKRRLLSIGSPSGVVAAFLGRLLTTRGQIIRRGASGVEAFQANTANQLLGGDGTDIVLRTPAQVRATLDLVTGSYTPTFTNIANLDASTAGVTRYIRVSDLVIVNGTLAVDPTAAAPTLTQLGISLPIASNLIASTDAMGVYGTSTVTPVSGEIFGDAANDRVTLQFFAQSAANQSGKFSFMYVIR